MHSGGLDNLLSWLCQRAGRMGNPGGNGLTVLRVPSFCSAEKVKSDGKLIVVILGLRVLWQNPPPWV